MSSKTILAAKLNSFANYDEKRKKVFEKENILILENFMWTNTLTFWMKKKFADFFEI